jgi:hypothetical protein
MKNKLDLKSPKTQHRHRVANRAGVTIERLVDVLLNTSLNKLYQKGSLNLTKERIT